MAVGSRASFLREHHGESLLQFLPVRRRARRATTRLDLRCPLTPAAPYGSSPPAIRRIASGSVSHSAANTRAASDSGVSSGRTGHRLLEEHPAVVVFVVHEVDRAARDRAAPLEHRPVDVHPVKALAAEGRQQRRMDVDHPAGEVRRNLHQMQKPSHHDKVGPGLAADAEDAARSRAPRPARPAACTRTGRPARSAILTPRTSPPAGHHDRDRRPELARRRSSRADCRAFAPSPRAARPAGDDGIGSWRGARAAIRHCKRPGVG